MEFLFGKIDEISGYYSHCSPDNEGLIYLLHKYYKATEQLHPYSNSQAIPEYRAFEKAKWYPDLTVEQAKKLLEEEGYWQKDENKNRYPGFKWF